MWRTGIMKTLQQIKSRCERSRTVYVTKLIYTDYSQELTYKSVNLWNIRIHNERSRKRKEKTVSQTQGEYCSKILFEGISKLSI